MYAPNKLHVSASLMLSAILAPAFAQDLSPLRDHHVWLPMTGFTAAQVDEALAAGYDTMLAKLSPPLAGDGQSLAPEPPAPALARANQRGMKLIIAILGWRGLSPEKFCDVEEDGTKLPGRLDPFDPQAVQQYERYCGLVIEHYASRPDVVAFAPTWGIYGEAGFTSWNAGRSPHALARFNAWLIAQRLPAVDRLPDRRSGPNTAFNRFVRFRYLYLEQQFDAIVRRLKARANGRPVGTWQELYPVVGYLWTMVRVPSADFALYESCFPFQTSHDPQRTLAEAMGFRYRCASAEQFRDYELPLLARKRGEGQRFMGCQLTNDYAVRQYAWSPEKAAQARFDAWEDEFARPLRKLLSEPLESPHRDVLLVFPTYAAATLTDRPCHGIDAMLIDVTLRQFGCQMVRIASPGLDRLTVAQMNAYKLIVVPAAAYLLAETLDHLEQTTATVLFTGCFGQALDGEYQPFGGARRIAHQRLRYELRPPETLSITRDDELTAGLAERIRSAPVQLPEDESFAFDQAGASVRTLLSCGAAPVMSCSHDRRTIFIHGALFAGLCYDPQRKPATNVSGSKDASANEVDTWGPYSSSDPDNAVGLQLMRSILDRAGVDYRVVDPEPRGCVPYLGDNMEVAGMSANLVYNNTARERTLTVRLPYAPLDIPSRQQAGRYLARVTVPAFSYVALQPAQASAASTRPSSEFP